MAERYYISLFNPQTNIVRYKTNLVVPPIERAQVMHIDIQCVPPWAVAYGAITGLKHQNVSRSPEIIKRYNQDWSARADYIEPTDPLDRLYGRAYRDPNHPDFRKHGM
jgi:hypothetical protein